MARFKTVRASEPNAGVRSAAARRLKKISREFNSMVTNDLLEFMRREVPAMDESLSHPDNEYDRKFVIGVATAVMKHHYELRRVRPEELDAFIRQRLPWWMKQVTGQAIAFARWFARSVTTSITASQLAALKAAGLSAHFVARRWPAKSGGRYMSPEAAAAVPSIVEEATNLVSNIHTSAISKLQDVIIEGLETNADYNTIRQCLEHVAGMSEHRAELIAIDQTNKVSNKIAIANSRAIGITEGVWVHVPGKYTSRDTHRQMNGERFDLSKGLFDPDPDVQRCVLPAELPYCRCFYRGVLPPEVLDAMKDE